MEKTRTILLETRDSELDSILADLCRFAIDKPAVEPPVPEAEAPHEQVQQVLTERNVQRAERLLFKLKSPQERNTLPAKERLEKQ